MFKFAAMLAALMLGTTLFSSGALLAEDSGHWSAYAPMPTPRHGLGAAVVDAKLFVIAGGPKPGASRSATNEIFVAR